MKSQTVNYLFSIIIFFLCLNKGFSNERGAVVANDTLIVGITGSEPFVFKNLKKGIAVEIWDELADENKWTYKYEPFDNVSSALDELDSGKIDLIVGPISITESRMENRTFTQPFYNSSISIMSLNKDLTLWQKISPFFSFQLLMAVFIFLIILAIVGLFLWLAERKASPEQFPNEPLAGIGTGMWLAIVTMSTTGYGDKAPITLKGRIIAGVWMIVSLISATSMVAGIASTLTLSSLGKTTINHIEQLTDSKTVTIKDSPAEVFLKDSNIEAITVDNIVDAITKLKNNEVSAVVYDRPQLLYYLKNNKNQDLFISKAMYYKQGYGFVLPLNSRLENKINKSLLKLSESHQKERITYFYLQKDE